MQKMQMHILQKLELSTFFTDFHADIKEQNKQQKCFHVLKI